MPFSPDLAPLRPVPSAPTAPPVTGQAARFLLIGGAATVVDVGLFNLLHFGVGVGPLGAKVLSTVVAGIVAFAGNREFSFGHQKDRSMSRQLAAFTAVSAAALLLNLLVIAVARYGLDLSSALALNVAANGVGLVLATALRFYGCRRWVFPPAERSVPAEPARAEPARLAA
jgi:putative flippase GtrA